VARLVDQYFALLGGEPLDPSDVLAADFCFRHPPLTPREGAIGRDRFLALVLAPTRAALRDMRFTIHDVVIDADRACARWSVTGTHEGDYLGVARTGRQIEVAGINIFRIEAGRIAETWVARDNAGLFRQLSA
jgi:steroid delta-isomerase-like uncharacterized protein